MAAKDFTDYVLDKANDVISVWHELEIELIELEGPVDAFIDDAVAAFREYLTSLADAIRDQAY